MSSKTLCPMIWNHQFIDGSGRVKPCCRFKGEIGKLEENLDTTFNGSVMQNIRLQMIAGHRPEGCTRCWQEEDSGKKSLRQRYSHHKKLGNINTEFPKIEWLELSISNECNLMCRMCDSKYSHRLFEEEKEYFGKTQSSVKNTKMQIEAIFPYISTLKHLKITGGEPLLTPDHWRLLDYIIDQNHADHIYLNYSTNCTVYPKKHIIERWKHFEYIELAISLDSIVAKENEYLRHGTKQNDVLKNIKRFCELQDEINLTVIARPTVTILNVFHLPETLEWLDNQNIRHNATHLTSPSHLSITVLPESAKKIILDKFKNYDFKNDITKKSCEYITNYMMSADHCHLFKSFKNHTKFLDEKRNQSFKETYPYFDF